MGTHSSTGKPQPSEQAYRLEFAVDGDILRVQVSGEVDAQPVRLAYWHEIVTTAQARHCRKLLVTDRKKGEPATSQELAELTHAFRELHDKFERVAVVEPTAEFMPAVEHAEIFARTLDINLRLFADAATAERWLRFGSGDD
jgi:hypothetical protein